MVSTEGSAETAGIRILPPLYYVAGFVAGIALELAVPTHLPSWLRVAGAILGTGLWLAFDGGAMRSFARARTPMDPRQPVTSLVTTGPYRFTRNPMYVGMAFLYLSFAAAFGMLWPIVFLFGVLVVIDRSVIAREEPYLERRFGQAYRDYSARVRRWL
jgi:protein-S-isoprenylcysteine O-methyltransferase Ste14